MSRYFIPFLVMLISCSNLESNCTITAIGLLKENGGPMFIVEDLEQKKLIIRDKGKDSIKGGEYSFYDNGKLKSYKFFETMNVYTYNEEYDNEGHLIKLEGKPLVSTKIREVNKDSALYSFFFVSLNKVYQNLNVSINDSIIFKLQLTRDTLYSNMKIASFGMDTKGLSRFKLYLHIEYLDNCVSKIKEFKDTISLVKNPSLNFE